MKQYIPNFYFTRKAVKRFMPGNSLDDAVKAALTYKDKGIGTVLTYLGENITSPDEAEKVTKHYISVLHEIEKQKLPTEISLKLTQIGLDLSVEAALKNFITIAEIAARRSSIVWIDMEGSAYTDTTLRFFEQARQHLPNIGLCLQAYLYKTEDDLQRIFKKPAHIRLVKGAYKESSELAFPQKTQVDENYLKLAQIMLRQSAEQGGRMVFGTHDLSLLSKIRDQADLLKIPTTVYEIHMLYGIRSADQIRLNQQGIPVRVLISYGQAWYPWYVRRLAERPANVWFVVRSMFGR